MLLIEKLSDKNIILASKSPRRSQLMEGCGIRFRLADNYEVEEVWPPQMHCVTVPEYLSVLKSEAYPERLDENDILITADTVVILDGEILGKPRDRDDAIKMLGKLSGNRHTVVTGVTIRDKGRRHTFSAATDVWFRDLERREIEYYVDNYMPLDKAGAYGIQEWIGYAGIRRIEGSFYNVMGLPIQTLYVNLENFINE